MTTRNAVKTAHEVIYVKATLESSDEINSCKRFAIDPTITNYNDLIGLLSKGFSIPPHCEFVVSYLTTDDFGKSLYLPLQSDWDLDAAILTSTDTFLCIKVTKTTPPTDLKDWDIVSPMAFSSPVSHSPTETGSVANSQDYGPSVFSHFSKRFTQTVAVVQRVIGLKTDQSCEENFVTSPVSDAEFRQFMDRIGRVTQWEKFYWAVYQRGLDASVRKVGWRLLLSTSPTSSSGCERLNLLQKCGRQYLSMKETWKVAYVKGHLSDKQLSTLAAVSIDVVRTDWTHPFYKGEKNRARVCQLFDLLATYCIFHPDVGYSQGMSDLASPLLVVQGEEAPAYLCFCSLMHRIKGNFHCSQQSGLLLKMHQLYDLIAYTDPHLAHFLRMRGLADMYFSQRWLMLELKREFNFDDSLRLLEAQWAVVAMVQSLAHSLSSVEEHETATLNLLTGDVSVLNYMLSRDSDSVTFSSDYTFRNTNLINSLIGAQYIVKIPDFPQPPIQAKNPVLLRTPARNAKPVHHSTETSEQHRFNSRAIHDIDDASVSLVCPLEKANHIGSPQRLPAFSRCTVRIDPESRHNGVHRFASVRFVKSINRLPPPSRFGEGNPLLLFLCLSLILEYREVLLASVNEPSDIVSFYQQRSQKHNVIRIFRRASVHFDRYMDSLNMHPVS